MNQLVYIFLLWAGTFFCYERYLEKCRSDFHKGMERNPEHSITVARKSAAWKFIEHLYNTYVINQLSYADEPRIPLILHHVWLGSPLPDYAKGFRYGWFCHNPDWTFILWTDYPENTQGDIILHSFDELKDLLAQDNHPKRIIMDMRSVVLHNQVALQEQARNYGVKSDLIRYEAMYHVGGLYVDTDFECLKPFDDLHHALDFYIGIAYDYRGQFSVLNGLMASVPGHPILGRAIELLHNRPFVGTDSLGYSGPHFLTNVILDVTKHHASRIVAFPVSYFYPMPHEAKLKKEYWIVRESYALHHWKKSWQ